MQYAAVGGALSVPFTVILLSQPHPGAKNGAGAATSLRASERTREVLTWNRPVWQSANGAHERKDGRDGERERE